MTLNNFYDTIEQFSINHYQLNNFGTGETDQLEASITNSVAFPFLWLTIKKATILEQTIQLDCSFLIFDFLKEDHSNLKNLLSDTQSIGIDLVMYLRNLTNDFRLVYDPSMTPFKDRLSTYLAGWNLETTIEIELTNNTCDLPLTELP